MSLKDCYNFNDFRNLAKKKLPSPIFHYIDGGSDDETTLRRNTDSFNECDLVPNVLAKVGKPDLSTTLFGRKIGISILLPNKVVDKSGLQTFAKVFGTKSQSSNEAVFLLKVDSSSAPPSM